MLSFRLKGRGTPYMQNTVRTQSDLFNVQCCYWDSKADGPPSQHCQSTEWSLHCSMLSFRLKGRWTPQSTLSEHRVISLLFNVVIQTHRQVDSPQNTVRAQSDIFTVQCCHSDSEADEPLGQHYPRRELSLHCSVLSFRFKGRWTPQSTLSENRVISSLFNVAIETQRQMDPQWTQSEHRVISSLFNVVIQTNTQLDCLCAKHCQSTEWCLHCSMLSSRLKGRWTPPHSTLSEHRGISSLFNVVIETERQMEPPWSTLSEHRVISSLFSVVIETQRCMDLPVNTVRAQGDLFTIQCCHSYSKAGGPPLVNTVRAQSYLFTVQCCHSYSNADGPPSQHCQSTEWSLHCSMLSFRFKGRWTPLVNTLSKQSDLFTVQCCLSHSMADGPPQSTKTEHRVISSLFNIVIHTQRQMDPYVQNTARAQSDLFTVQCCHSDPKTDGPPWSTLSEQSYLFTVQCCHSDSKADGSHSQHCQSTEWSLHCSMLSFRLKGRWTPYVQNTARAQSDLFTVQCCHWASKADGPPWSTLSEHRVISSLFNVVIQTQRQTDTPQSTLSEHRVISSLFNVVIQTQRQMNPLQNTVRAQSDLFTVQCCHSDSKADGNPWSTLSEQSYLFTVQCCHSDSKADGRHSQHCQSTELSLHCSMLSFRLKGRWTPYVQNTARAQSDLFTVQYCHWDSKADGPHWSTLSEHRVISSLFNVVIQTQRQMATRVNTVRAQSYLFTVQCCHSDSKADGPNQSTLSEHRVISSLFNVVIETQRQMDLTSQHCQSTEWSLHCSMLLFRLKGRLTPPSQHCQNTELSLHCSMLSFRLKGRWTPCKTLSEHRVISSLFNVVIQTQGRWTPCKTQSEDRVISSLFNVVIQTQRQVDRPWSTLSEHRVISSLFNVVIPTQMQMDPPANTVRAQSDLFTVQCCHSDSKADGPPWSTLSEHRVISSLFNVVIQIQRQMDPPGQHCQSTEWSLHCSMLSFRLKGRWTHKSTLSEHRVISSLFNVVIQTQRQTDTPQSTLSEHSVISSLFNVVIQTQRQKNPLQNTVRAQSDLFTVQCCHSDSKADGNPWSTLSEQSYLFTVQCWYSDSNADGPPSQHCQSTEWSLHCSMLSLRLKGRWTPLVNTVRAQGDFFTVQCCHSDSKADGPPPDQHCQNTDWSLHCSMLSFRLKGRWTPLVNTVRAQSDFFTVQCCHSDSKADGPPLINTVRTQSDLFTVQCCHSDSKADGPPMCKTLPEHRVISSLFNVVIQTQRQMDPPGQLCQSRDISSLFNVVIQTQRQMDPTVNIVRVQSDLFPVQCCHSDSKADGHTSQHCQSTEWSLHCSMLSFRLRGIWTPLVKCVRAELSLHCSTLSFRLKGRWSPYVQNTPRAQSDLFTLQYCHSDSKADGPPGQHCQSTEWSLHCSMLSFRLKGRWPPESTLSEHRVISSLFNVVIQTQRQRDPPSQHCQSTELSLHCSMLSLRPKGRWTSPVNTVRAQSDLFTVQCCHWDSKADCPPSQHCQNTELSLHCSMFSFRLKGRRTPCKTLSEHRVISSLFNVVIMTHTHMNCLCAKQCQSTEWSLRCSMLSFRLKGRWTPCKTQSEDRVISSLFNVVIQI